jgi:hypothetical protein
MKRNKGNLEENFVLQAQIDIMDSKIEMMEAQHKEDEGKTAEMMRRIEEYKIELAEAKK